MSYAKKTSCGETIGNAQLIPAGLYPSPLFRVLKRIRNTFKSRYKGKKAERREAVHYTSLKWTEGNGLYPDPESCTNSFSPKLYLGYAAHSVLVCRSLDKVSTVKQSVLLALLSVSLQASGYLDSNPVCNRVLLFPANSWQGVGLHK